MNLQQFSDSRLFVVKKTSANKSMGIPVMLKILSIFDDIKCYKKVGALRWPNGVICPHCDSPEVVKNGHLETRYEPILFCE